MRNIEGQDPPHSTQAIINIVAQAGDDADTLVLTLAELGTILLQDSQTLPVTCQLLFSIDAGNSM